MSQLSAQSIFERCARDARPMISPFSAERHIVNGKSWGLSAASYDVRIAHALVLGPHPGYLMRDALGAIAEGNIRAAQQKLSSLPPCTALAHTIEDFIMPDDVSAQVCDKSSYARVMVSAFNTFFDPGFEGNATLELVNLGPEIVEIKAGDPICQMIFTSLDRPTDRPYRGKYQHQKKRAQTAIFEIQVD